MLVLCEYMRVLSWLIVDRCETRLASKDIFLVSSTKVKIILVV